jgi:hypothetical protein
MEAHSEAQTEKTINDTERAGGATEAPQEGSTAISPTATRDHTAERDEIISSPDIPLEEKTEAVLDAAGEALYQAGEYDQNELREMAIVPRNAQTLTEAETIVRNKENGFINKPITNAHFNITATVSENSLSEMTNEKQVKKAVSPRLQAKAVANADVLFERALVHTTHPDTHGREEIRQVHRLGALMEDGGEYVPVKLTVIEYVKDDYGNRIYAIEAVDIEKMKPPGLLPQPSGIPETSDPIEDFNNNLIQLAEFVKPNEENNTLFQTAWNGSAAMFDRFDNYYAGRSGFAKTHGWGHSFYSQREAADWFSKRLEEYKGASGWLYEAKIPDDTEFIEWEKPLSSQPETVKNTAGKLISWNKDGKSNFNEAYNLRQFKNGEYGFFRSINGERACEKNQKCKRIQPFK